MVSCVELSFLSNIFSTISLGSWICAQLPQIYINYKHKSAEAISPSFLLLWFAGDFLSFTSCLLNEVVLKFQVYLSLFFLTNDVILCLQYYYYNSVYPKKYGAVEYLEENTYTLNQSLDLLNVLESRDINTNGASDSNPLSASSTSEIHIRAHANKSDDNTLSLVSSLNSGYNSVDDNKNRNNTAKAISIATMFNMGGAAAAAEYDIDSSQMSLFMLAQNLGVLLAWGCTAVYISSRLPQLYKNYKTKSVEGISPLLFGSALIGNLTYTLSILTSCDFIFDTTKKLFLLAELPYILGSSGTVIFDIAYFYQRHIYRDFRRNTLVMSLEDFDNEPI
ncbi:uncharacterized protein PRCAT00002609001 [Priceomyces carsonii]|uniref:uncharacterized protein n=1 Tax=Priceomyces carsonii TaxID=28549 RepID=UPI002EDABD13|nr:unnamed protein product [Priceomyces carsonii]